MGKGKQILVVDDDNDILDLYTEVIGSVSGFHIVTAQDGVDAYRKARIVKYDLICTDFKMPKLNGVQLISALRENDFNKSTPIIIATGYSTEARTLCKQSGVRNIQFLEKPFDKEMLKAVINQLTTESAKGPSQAKFKVTAEFLAAFVEATKELFTKMLDAKDIKILSKEAVDFNNLQIDITSNMQMITEKYHIYIVLAFPKETFFKVVESMLGEVYTEIEPDIEDAIAEVLNILYCNAQKSFLTSDLVVSKTPPKATSGSAAWIEASQGKFIPIAFESSIGQFYIGFNVKAV